MKTLTELAKRVENEGYAPVLPHPEVRRLCELVAAAEREACAKMVEDWDSDSADPRDIAAAIRARGNT
jgi:hypothetical protein